MPFIRVRVVADRMLRDLMEHALAAEDGIGFVDLGSDVTVLDATFPRVPWETRVEELRSESAEAAIIVLSDDDEEDTAVAAARAGVAAWLPRGVAIDELVDVVRIVGAGGGYYPARHLGAVLRALRSDVEHATSATSRLAVLTERERHVLRLLMAALPAREIAVRLGVSVNTVRTHTHRIFRKLDVHHRLEAVRVARSAGMVSESDDE